MDKDAAGASVCIFFFAKIRPYDSLYLHTSPKNDLKHLGDIFVKLPNPNPFYNRLEYANINSPHFPSAFFSVSSERTNAERNALFPPILQVLAINLFPEHLFHWEPIDYGSFVAQKQSVKHGLISEWKCV